MRLIVWKLFEACEEGDIDTAQKLLEQGANPNAKDDHGRTPIIIAAEKGHIPIIALLIRYGANPYVTDKRRESALHYATFYGHHEVVQYLITDIHLDPNVQGRSRRTPFMIAAENGDIKMLRLLIQLGADPYAQNLLGKSALHYALENQKRAIAQYLITHFQVDPNTQDYSGITPFILATKNGDIKMLRLLIQHGANPYTTDAEGRNALHYAVRCGNPQVVSFLMTYLHFDPNLQDHEGVTPLLLAIKNLHYDIVQVLTQLGANHYIPDHDGITPAYIAHFRRIPLEKPKPSTITL